MPRSSSKMMAAAAETVCDRIIIFGIFVINEEKEVVLKIVAAERLLFTAR